MKSNIQVKALKFWILMTSVCGFKLGLEWLPLPSLELDTFPEIEPVEEEARGLFSQIIEKLFG